MLFGSLCCNVEWNGVDVEEPFTEDDDDDDDDADDDDDDEDGEEGGDV